EPRVRSWEPPVLKVSRKPLESDEQALAQAGRIVEHLRSQLSEMDRREQGLNSQLTAFDQEQRSFRLRVRDFEDLTRERERTVRELESRAIEKQAQYERRLAELDEIEKTFAQQRSELEAERAGMKEALAAEIIDERKALTLDQEQFRTDRDAHEQAAAQWEE